MTETLSRPILTDSAKKKLKAYVIAVRRNLEEDLGKKLKRLGIDPDLSAAVSPEQLSYLEEGDLKTRRVLDAVLVKEQAMTGSFAGAVDALRREAAYTHLNRLVGLKCLELRGHLVVDGERTEVITSRSEYGGRPKLLWVLRERENRYRRGEDADELLWRDAILGACRVVSEEIHVLFDPADPYAEIWPSHRTLRESIDGLNELPEEAFQADELLGWVYQYFQTEEKARVFEAVRTQKKKISWPDVVPVTELYTERYMVDFLLQNSLGARWMEMYPDSGVRDNWPYYVTPATPYTRQRSPVKDWTVLDPCVGSGHFLVVAFDLLVQLYAEERHLAQQGAIPSDWTVPAPEVARTILERNLHGIDIDPRAVQIAALALYLKGKEHGLGSDRPPRLNLVVADAVLSQGRAYQTLLKAYAKDPVATEAILAIWHALEHVRELGSLVRVEEEVDVAIQEHQKAFRKAGVRPSRELDDYFGKYRGLLLRRLHDAFDTEMRSVDLSEHLFGVEGEKGVNLLELLTKRYDVVCTNPPYMGSKNMGPTIKDFVASHYKAGKRDLYAAFILRCRQLAKDCAHVAMVTQQSWMFLPSYVDLRDSLLANDHVGVLSQHGRYAFSEVTAGVVRPVLLVLKPSCHGEDNQMTAFRLTATRPAEEQAQLLRLAIQGVTDQHIRYIMSQTSLQQIYKKPLLYWLSPDVLGLFQHSTLRDHGKVLQGLATADDSRFLRYHWEVPAFGQVEWNAKPTAGRWFPFAKGGGYGRWFGLNWYAVDWGLDGDNFRKIPGPVIRNEHDYFKLGWSYSLLCHGSTGVRSFDVPHVFGHKGPALFSEDPAVPCVIQSRVGTFLLRALNPNLAFEVGSVGSLPWPSGEHPSWHTDVWVAWKKRMVAADPTDRTFRELEGESVGAPQQQTELLALTALLLSGEGMVEDMVRSAYGLTEASYVDIVEATGPAAGSYRVLNGYEAVPDLKLDDAPPSALLDFVQSRPRLSLSDAALALVKERTRILYQAGPGAEISQQTEPVVDDDSGEDSDADEDDDAAGAIGAGVPIPTESFLEELCHKLEIHPISVYWLLEEMRRGSGFVCPPEVRRRTEDFFSVKLLRMLGHRWPLQDRYEEGRGGPFLEPHWVDSSGVFVLTQDAGTETLRERFERFLDTKTLNNDGVKSAADVALILGWKPGDVWGKQKPTALARWFERDFFKRHVSQFKRRPIVWHLSSPRGGFQAIVYYHKFDQNSLKLLRSRYVQNTLDAIARKLGDAQRSTSQNLSLVSELEERQADVREFDDGLRRLLEGREREARIWCPWKTPEEQPVGWDPDINDGVRVNIAPVQRLGLLASDVLAAKDLKSLLAPESRR